MIADAKAGAFAASTHCKRVRTMTESDHDGVRGAGAARPDRRRLILGAFGLTAAPWVSILDSKPAAAHHGWPGFDTSRLIYLAGAVSSEGTWGNPHSLFDVALAAPLPSSTPKLTVPPQLHDADDIRRVTNALSYSGPHKQLQIVIAPPAWSGRWGLGRALKIGEQFQAVGYINRTDDRLFRPVVFWYGDDAVPVNQLLGNSLPA
ncbi:hypothetical protein SAMN04515666_11563 [Bosea lupini]|uniref:Uncharacterized protein n=2 Tax=Bosea lupini TaxID=1036779 RepID=A0A1H7ZPE9_9HYPH|nr:hypothetical protein SAMN04515666_11563 [Bosea lupini]